MTMDLDAHLARLDELRAAGAMSRVDHWSQRTEAKRSAAKGRPLPTIYAAKRGGLGAVFDGIGGRADLG